ncbi:MAG: hypothetical protein ACTS2F_10785 [Thainema sp.]
MRPGTTISLPNTTTAGALLTALSDLQRQRLAERIDVLNCQGVEPGDTWQVAVSHQRRADLPGYELTEDEQKVMERTAQQVSGQAPEQSLSVRSHVHPISLGFISEAESSDSETTGTAEDSVPYDEELVADERLQFGPERSETATHPLRIIQQSRQHSLHPSGLSPAARAADGEASPSDTDPQEAMAQSILDHAGQVIDSAIARGAEPDAEGIFRAENTMYAVTLQPDGVMWVENRQTGGITIGDETGVKVADGLTITDQQTWQSIRQLSEAEHQQEQAQRTPNRQQRSPDLEL